MNGLRPVNIQHDLRDIADLIELCFSDRMDSSGRAAIAEMRAMAKLGIGLRVIQMMDRMLKGIMQGYVWEAEGQIVGNVSLYPAGYNRTWVIANVAVHPNYRGQGISKVLCQQALNRIVQWGGRAAILQVDADNEIAQNLYYRLGFWLERGFTHWNRSGLVATPKPLPDMPRISYRAWKLREQVYDLTVALRPNEFGGLGWLRPTDESYFQSGISALFKSLFSANAHEEFVIRDGDHILGAVIADSRFGSSKLRFDLLVHTDYQQQLEPYLINYIIRHANLQYRGVYTEHPADDTYTNEILKENQFVAQRTLMHMRWEP